MSIPEKVLKLMKCCCANECDHIVQDALLLNCGGNVCKTCVEDCKKKEIKCKYCNRVHKKDELLSLPANPNVAVLIDTFSNELKSLLKIEVMEKIRILEDYCNHNRLGEQLDLMEAEIEIRIETLRQQISKLSAEFKKDINRIRESWTTLVPFEEINRSKETMRRFNSNFKEMQQKCAETKELILTCFSKLNNVRLAQGTY